MANKPFEIQDGIKIQTGDDILDSTGTSAFAGGGSANLGDITVENNNTLTIEDARLGLRSFNPYGSEAKIELDAYRIRSQVLLPNSNTYSINNGFDSAAWTPGEGGVITFTTPQQYVIDFLNNEFVGNNRTIQINGSGPEYQFYGFNGTDQIYISTNPDTDPTAVTEIRFSYEQISKIDIDPDEGDLDIVGAPGVDINITAGDDLYMVANDRVDITAGDRLQLRSGDNSVRISTNYDVPNATQRDWYFNTNGGLQFPDGSTQTTAFLGSDANVWVQDFTAANLEPSAIIGGATSVEYDADGNIIALFAVTTANYDYTSTVVAKFNTLGVKQWELIFGSGDFTDGWGLAVDPVGNWGYVAGRTSISGSYNQSLLTRIDLTDGSISWSKQLDFESASDSPVVDVAGDGNPVLVGYATNGTDNYIHVVKLLAGDGSFIWGKTLDGYGDEEAYGMGVGPAGEVVVVGFEQQFLPPNTVATISIEPVVSNPNWTTGTGIFVGDDFSCTVSFTGGVPTFTNIVDRVGNRTVGDVIASVQGAGLGGADGADDMTIKVGTVSTVTNNNRVLVAKYAANGDLSWQKSIEIDAGYQCSGADADIDSNGNIYVCGQFDNPDNNGDQAMFLFQMNSAGVGQWTRKVSGNCEDAATSIVIGPDDHLYLSGVTGNNNTEDFNLVIAKYNLDGTVVWQRLLDNTTTWTFNGVFWFGDGSNGGSNLAVKNGYVAIAGGFADPFGTIPQAIVAQIDTDGTQFAAGNYDFKNASFSGLLTSAPTIVNDIRVDGIVQPNITDLNPGVDINFGALVGDLHVAGSVSVSNVSINNNAYSVSVAPDGVVSMVTSRGTLEFGALPEPGGPDHFHIMPAANQNNTMDLYFGDDYNYVLQRPAAANDSPAYGVEIGANDRDGGDQHVWRFDTDGRLGKAQDLTLTTSGQFNICTIQNAGSGYTSSTPIPAATTGGTGTGMTVNFGYGLSGQLASVSVANPGTGYTNGNVITVNGGTGTFVLTRYNDQANQANNNTVESDWVFSDSGNLTLPRGSVIGETATTTVITPPGAAAGQSLVVRPTSGQFSLATDHPSGFVPGETITITVGTLSGDQTGTLDYEFTGAASQQLGRALTGTLTFTSETEKTITWTVPAQSSITTFTFSLIDATGFDGQGGVYVPGLPNFTITLDGTSVEVSHVHLMSGDPTTVDLYLGDDDQYVKIEKNGGDVVVGTNSNTNHWRFDTDGALTFPDNTIQTTAYPGITTVAMTGAILGANDMAFEVTAVDGSGVVTEITITNTPNAAWQSNGAGTGVTVGDLSFTVQVDGSGNATVSGITSSGGHSIGEVFTASGDGFGAGITPTVLDLTKSVNKLTEGEYTLANGVEGQIMYLVPSPGVTVPGNIEVVVANFLDGLINRSTQGYLYFNDSIITLIFTDGAWAQTGGTWD